MEAIILAGGLGTRLRSVVNDIPKSMAAIRSKPFLEYQLDLLIKNGVQRFIFSVGYKSESISNHFSNKYKNCEIVYALEEKRLGTGGAIKNAMRYVKSKHVVVVNGDSLFKVDIQEQYKAHLATKADVTLALKPMVNFERYGTVELATNERITKFLEKQPIKKGLINGGLYIFKVASFNKVDLPEVFSIEREFFENRVDQLQLFGFITEGYFLDIGIPKDFQKAQFEMADFAQIDQSWTLFLDRDGVINRKRENDYVKTAAELEILPDAIEAIVNFSNFFGRIIIITNQQGVGKGLMNERDLHQIHQTIRKAVKDKGGKIDAIYYAPQLVGDNSCMRKPEIGMAVKARNTFPTIDFSKSIMVGDSRSDMEFGKQAGMIQVFISQEEIDHEEEYRSISLGHFSKLLNSILR